MRSKARNSVLPLVLLVIAMALVTASWMLVSMPAYAEDEATVKEIEIESENDEHTLWSDDQLVFSVNVPDGVEGTLDFYGGKLNENSTSMYDRWEFCFTGEEFFTYDDSRGTLTLNGENLFHMMNEYREGQGHLDIHARVIDDSTNPVTVLAEGFSYADIREARYDYDLPEDREILPEWSEWINGQIHARIENAEYPDGRDFNLPVSDVSIDSEKTDEGSLQLERNADGWDCRGIKPGDTVLNIKYEDYDGTQMTHSITIAVKDTVYDANMWPVEGVYQGLPGGSIELQAHGEKNTARPDEHNPDNWQHDNTSEGLIYDWSITNGSDFGTITQDPEDPTKAILTFSDMPEGWDHIGERVDVRVSIYDKNSEDGTVVRAERTEDYWVNDEYVQIHPATSDPNIDVGQSFIIDPELRLYRLGQQGYEVLDGADFEIVNYDVNALSVAENEGGFVITRKAEWDTNFCVRAEWQVGEGEPNSVEHWYHLNRRDYNIRFEHDDRDIYDDETLTLNLVKEGLEGLEDELKDPGNTDYEITYTVGSWNGDEWEYVLPSDKYEADADGITISGSAIKEAGLDGVNIRADLSIDGTSFGGENYQRDTWCWLSLRDACADNNHKWVTAVVKEATCLEKGRQVKICLRHPFWHDDSGCGKVVFEDIDLAPHKVGKVAAKDSTLTATGNTAHYKCSVCGRLFSDAVAQNEISPSSVVVPKKINISGASIAAIKAVTYNTKAQKPALTVKYGSTVLKAGTDYTVSYKANTNAGKATATITGKGKYAGTKAATFTINKATNPVKLGPKKVTVKYAAVSKKNQTVKQASACTVSSAQGKVTWKKSSGNAKITVASGGNVTVKKGLKKGTYKIGVKATAAGNTNYKAATKSATITIVVN